MYLILVIYIVHSCLFDGLMTPIGLKIKNEHGFQLERIKETE